MKIRALSGSNSHYVRIGRKVAKWLHPTPPAPGQRSTIRRVRRPLHIVGILWHTGIWLVSDIPYTEWPELFGITVTNTNTTRAPCK